MPELPDLDLRSSVADSDKLVPPPERSAIRWLLAVLLTALIGAAIYVVFRPEPLPPPSSDSASKPTAAAVASSPRPLGGRAEAITIPGLDQSDPVVRRLVRALSTQPAVLAWLRTTGLIRNFAVVVSNIADGASPAKFLTTLRPSLGFRTIERNGKRYIDPRSYDRYSTVADATASVDPAAAAGLYATLKPRIQEAFQDLGLPGSSLDRTVQRAIVSLLDTPDLSGPVQLKPKGIGYAYADERLESLTRAQKHFLRMGPRNVRIIKERLREIALALGIPSSELPASVSRQSTHFFLSDRAHSARG